MSEADRVFLKVALAVLWIAWLAVVGLVVWICAQWRKERQKIRANELTAHDKIQPWTCAIDGCGKEPTVRGHGSFSGYCFCSEACASKYD